MKIQSYFKHLLLLLLGGLLILGSGCSRVEVPQPPSEAEQKPLTAQEVKLLTAQPPFVAEPLRAEYSPLPDKPLQMPSEGETTPLGVKVSPELELAFRSYLGGDGERALARLAQLDQKAEDSAVLWQSSFLRAQILLMMGRGSDAEQELKRTSRLEDAHFGSTLNALALQGEVKVWLEDYNGAMQDFAQVIRAIGTWELPISYSSFPTNREDLYYLTTAKLRAYTGLAGIHLFQEDMLAARAWAQEAERLYNNAHFVMNHSLYGLDEVHADSYYGRAMNLTFLAAAQLGITRDVAAAEKTFALADGFYRVLGYAAGQVTVAALKARTFNRLGMHDLCYEAGQYAMKLALAKGLPDYVWRIGVLTGITLLEYGQVDKAELAFRQAQNSVDAISGSLNSDRAKIRFGVGKNDIIYHLARIDIQKKNWELLFSDLERARARSFVDLLADQALTRDREPQLMAEIRKLERALVRQKLLNMAPGLFDPKGMEKEAALRRQHQEKVALLQQRDPEMAELITVRHAQLKDVQKAMTPEDMMAYAIPGKPGDPVQFLMVRKNGVELRKMNVSYRDVTQLLANFSGAFQLTSEDEERGVELVNKAAVATADVSPKQVLSKLNQSFPLGDWNVQGTIYVVSSGDLYFLPWGALDQNQPVVSLPTGSWLTRQAQAVRSLKKAVVVGDPEFGGELSQLPGARREAQAVADLYQGQPLLGKAAAENALRSQVGDGTDILHLATHGIFDSEQPLQSAIFLTQNGMARPLTAARIYEEPLPARLVILSACETGLGQTIAGDDLLGLTRSFFLGGAVSTLSSLWQIEDEGTMEFMRVFHQNAKTGDYAAAWLAARNYVKEKGYPASVYGAFVLSGAAR